MAKGKRGEWLRDYVEERVGQRTVEKSNMVASIMLVELLRVNGVDGAVQLMKEPGALTVNGSQIVPERFLPTRLGKSKFDLSVPQDNWRSPVDVNFAVSWADNQDLRVEVARDGMTQADVVSRLKELGKRSVERVTQRDSLVDSTRQTTEAASATEIAQALNLDVQRVRLTAIHNGGTTPGSFKMGAFRAYPVLAVSSNQATRDVLAEARVNFSAADTGIYGGYNWLTGMSDADIERREQQMQEYRGAKFWEQQGYKTFKDFYAVHDPILMNLDAGLMPQISGVSETVNMFNRSMLLSVRACVAAMTDANVAKHVADLAAGNSGDLAWLVDSRRIDSMIAKFGVVDSALKNAQSTVSSMLEYCLTAVDSSDGSIVILPADVLATMAAALNSIFTGLEAGRFETAASFIAAGANPDQISDALRVDARLLRNRR